MSQGIAEMMEYESKCVMVVKHFIFKMRNQALVRKEKKIHEI